MDPIEKQERKRDAQRRLRSQRQRAGLLRSRVIAISLVAFALLWGTVFVQMATGNDPVLGDSSRTATVRPRTAAAHSHSQAAASPTEADAATDSVEASAAGAAAAEATETTAPEELEPEAVEPEPVETEAVEPEPEPTPVITSQS
jgi:cytoskeletal protein RodZ